MIPKVSAATAVAVIAASAAYASGPTFYYVPNSLAELSITNGPWVLHQTGNAILPAYNASGISVPSPAGTPYASYCDSNGKVVVNQGKSVMQPYYFPFVRKNGAVLEGFFDYRPRNEQEATVNAYSTDLGVTWHVNYAALGLNPYCPWDPTDANNSYVVVNGAKTTYGLNGDNAADNGLGHPVALTVAGVQRLYLLNRANNHIDSDQLVVHTLPANFLPPKLGLQSPFASDNYAPPTPPVTGNYPTLDATAKSTTGLINPDAILGAVNFGKTGAAVIYVSKTLNGTQPDTTGTSYPNLPPNYPLPVKNCAKTPDFALTNIINGSGKKANYDVIAIRVATTTDGLNFTDVGAVPYGPAPGALANPNSVGTKGTADSFGGIRWLGSGSIVPLADGRYGMFFGAGNCLDNDSDGFHFLGYAETQNVVSHPTDLLLWNVINGLDNPIMSTDTVTDYSSSPVSPYPKQAAIVNLTGVNLLTAAQVLPWTPPTPALPIVTPPGGYNSNFFSGRLYDPQALYTDDHTLTIVFAGYNTPQPSNNLGDYRSIGRVQLQVPTGYFAPF